MEVIFRNSEKVKENNNIIEKEVVEVLNKAFTERSLATKQLQEGNVTEDVIRTYNNTTTTLLFHSATLNMPS